MQGFVARLRETHIRQYNINDKAHRLDHIDSVWRNAQALMEHFDEGEINQKMVAIAVFTHDLFSWSRNNHHLLAAEYVRTTDAWYMEDISDEDRETIALAVEQHRASYTGDYSTIYSEIMASADKNEPTNLIAMIKRSISYAESRLQMDYVTAVQHAFDHMVEKFGRDGYCQYPPLYLKFYEDELEDLWADIDNLRRPTEDEVAEFSLKELITNMNTEEKER